MWFFVHLGNGKWLLKWKEPRDKPDTPQKHSRNEPSRNEITPVNNLFTKMNNTPNVSHNSGQFWSGENKYQIRFICASASWRWYTCASSRRFPCASWNLSWRDKLKMKMSVSTDSEVQAGKLDWDEKPKIEDEKHVCVCGGWKLLEKVFRYIVHHLI